MQAFGDWLYATSISTNLRDISWVVPALQSIHILALAVLLGAALLTDLRLAGVLASDVSPAAVIRAHMPRMWAALLVLLASGLLLVLCEPGRTLGNTLFWIKMSLVVVGFVITLLIKRPLMAVTAGADVPVPGYVKAVAWLSLLIWVVVVFCGRWIAYT